MKTTNKVELDGFIGMEPEVKTLSNGSKLVRFSLATNEDYKNKAGEWVKNTTWHNVIMWNKIAEKAEETLKKGTRVSVTGKLVNRQYTDKEGNKRNTFEIQAFAFELSAAA
ncbi:MAG: single-stranded DNA-binding protein [Bacteroidales bacterium]|jgi:single-strand DNA-binding protein